VLLAGARDEELFGLRIAEEAQHGIFFHQLVNAVAQLVFVGARLRLDGEGDGRLGESDLGYWMGEALSPSVSPVSVSLSFATAPMSPACSSFTGMAVLPCMQEMCANFSAVLRVKFCSVASFFSTPEYTLKNEIRPAKGSLMVLKTKMESGSESLTLRVAGSPLWAWERR